MYIYGNFVLLKYLAYNLKYVNKNPFWPSNILKKKKEKYSYVFSDANC